MTTEEFSNNFDTEISAYLAAHKFGDLDLQDITFNEYEKSLFLTQYQNDLIQELYTGKNVYSESFEDTEELRVKLAALLKTVDLTVTTSTINLASNSYIFTLPADFWFAIYEQATVNNNIITVTPITHADYMRTIGNPFRGPSAKRVLRLNSGTGTVELISSGTISTYKLRYISKPTPIILTDLPGDLTIEGIAVKTECALNTSIHREILEGAIRLALQSRALIATTQK